MSFFKSIFGCASRKTNPLPTAPPVPNVIEVVHPKASDSEIPTQFSTINTSEMADIQRWKVTEPYLDLHCGLGEGPYYQPGGYFRMVDIKKHRIHVIDLNKGPSSLRTIQLDMPVGVTADIEGIDPQKKILIAGKSGIAVLDMDTEKYEYLTHFLESRDNDERLRSNDGAVDPQGRFWIGTMNDFNVGEPGPEGKLWRIDADLSRHEMKSELTIPNGLGWTKDHKTMYFTHSSEATIYAYDFDAEHGTTTNERVFWKHDGSGDPDGFMMDEEGCLWEAIYGESRILRIRPGEDGKGKVVGQVDLPTENITCVCFVGTDLFITSAGEEYSEGNWKGYGGGLFKVDVGVHGVSKTPYKMHASKDL
jgi:sugar lactone lactonase YvrE